MRRRKVNGANNTNDVNRTNDINRRPPLPDPLGEPGSFEQESISGEDIARRAYQLFEERGAAPGYDLDDWYRAERDLREQHRRANGNG
jgi:hypothetical protein